jgi:hypothetical protein
MLRTVTAFTLILSCLCSNMLFADAIDDQDRLYNDMMIVDYWNNRLNERLPVTYNHLLLGGYLNMPSARMGNEGELGFGFASVPPYYNYNLRCQLTDRIEISGNYRVFRGIDDPVLSSMGFGDLSDKGANIKFSLLCPEESNYTLPGLAIGFDDIMGTRNFTSKYIVATKVFLDYGLEVSLGYGIDRFRGFFGGVSWMPFHRCKSPYLKDISLVAEYDATPYKDSTIEKHPKGRDSRSPVNVGIKYRLFDHFDFSASYIRGKAMAYSVSTFYNFGMTKGLLPKINDPLPYVAPVNIEPIGPLRTGEVLAQDFVYALRDQGFFLLEANVYYDACCLKTLRLHIINPTYSLEPEVRSRISNILAYLGPSDMDKAVVVIEADGFPIQEYLFYMPLVREYAQKKMGPHELRVVSPMREVTYLCNQPPQRLFKLQRDWYNIELFPKTHTLFGSSRGKFKCSLGLGLGINGFLFDSVFYTINFGYLLYTNLQNVTGTDRLNPSQLPNVRTTVVRYYRQRGLTLDQAYLQKNWNMGKGWFSRISLGYFEEQYAGLANEYLYYPVNSNWAIGIEGAVFKRRRTSGLGLTDEVRQLHGFKPYYHKFRFAQYFLSLYYDWKDAGIDFKVSGGKFLADDYGVRTEVTRYFPSGMRVSFWYTYTNGHDKVNGHVYYDKGVAISFPMDIFYMHTERERWGYGLSAWLRDVGVSAYTGTGLYDMIRQQRNEY